MSKMYKFAHLFDAVLSIYFVPFARNIIFVRHLRHYSQLLVAKSTSAKIFFPPLQHMGIFASDFKSTYIILSLDRPILPISHG
jgi:hypothetical protein